MAAAAAVLIRKEKDIVEHFRYRKAVTADAAQSLGTLDVEENTAFRILRRRAVIREASPGLFYLDELSWQAAQDMRRRMAVVMICVVLLILVVGAIATRTSVVK